MKKLYYFFLICTLIAFIGGLYGYKIIFGSAVELPDEESFFYVPTGSSYEALIAGLESNYGVEPTSFNLVAKLMQFDTPKPGRYKLEQGWSNKELISNLRRGNQQALSLTFNNARNIEQLCGMMASKLESDSLSFLNHFVAPATLKKYGVTRETVMTLFIPNTYQIFWNSSPESVISRFASEQKTFYNKSRTKKLASLDMTKEEVYTLASIVQKETLVNEEKPRVAGVYINRLKRGQLLQADPTVVFANQDFTIKRVLNRHLAKDSPYNTYKYDGLPPGPICMPDVSSIDAVLNYEKHKYLYFCAAPDNSGRHQFARSLIEHNRNADKYRALLNKLKIYK
jgi:UPF0755 protein